jgi:hypothetical protein
MSSILGCREQTRFCHAQRILLCGWGETAFMSNLLRELSSGPAALPRNSEIVLFNALTTAQQQQRLADCSRVGSAIGIRHVQGNPLNRSDMAHKIDISECDARPGASSSRGSVVQYMETSRMPMLAHGVTTGTSYFPAQLRPASVVRHSVTALRVYHLTRADDVCVAGTTVRSS